MALAGGVRVVNCKKNYTYTLILEDESYGNVRMKRGDSAGTGKYVCEDAPKKYEYGISADWGMSYINLNIQVEKKREEVNDPREGIVIECQEFDCPFNKSKER